MVPSGGLGPNFEKWVLGDVSFFLAWVLLRVEKNMKVWSAKTLDGSTRRACCLRHVFFVSVFCLRKRARRKDASIFSKWLPSFVHCVLYQLRHVRKQTKWAPGPILGFWQAKRAPRHPRGPKTPHLPRRTQTHTFLARTSQCTIHTALYSSNVGTPHWLKVRRSLCYVFVCIHFHLA